MQRVIITALAVIISLPVVIKSRVSGISSPPAAFPVLSSQKVLVRVGGDVDYSGIYSVNANELTINVINMAIKDNAKKYLILNETGSGAVADGADLTVKRRLDGTAMVTFGSMPTGEKLVLGIPLDINCMSTSDFVLLPGVGPVMAGRIIEYRQNNGGNMKIEDLLAVEGIGRIKYQKLLKYF